MDKELIKKCLLDEKEIGKAITNADCGWHGITPEFAEANPDYLCPDGGWNEVDSTPLWFFNRAISEAATIKAIPIIQEGIIEILWNTNCDTNEQAEARTYLINCVEQALKGETNEKPTD